MKCPTCKRTGQEMRGRECVECWSLFDQLWRTLSPVTKARLAMLRARAGKRGLPETRDARIAARAYLLGMAVERAKWERIAVEREEAART